MSEKKQIPVIGEKFSTEVRDQKNQAPKIGSSFKNKIPIEECDDLYNKVSFDTQDVQTLAKLWIKCNNRIYSRESDHDELIKLIMKITGLKREEIELSSLLFLNRRMMKETTLILLGNYTPEDKTEKSIEGWEV